MADNYYPITFNENGDSFVITNNGTAPAPCKITIIPKVHIMLLTIQGLSKKPITFSQLKTNEVLVIDGENRAITVNDVPAFNKYGGWEFPKLQPGANNVIIPNGAHLSLSIEFNARYL